MSSLTSDHPIAERARRNALSNPQKKILIDGNREWTWSELWAGAEGFAHQVVLAGFGDIVPVLVGRNGETAIAMLGCILAGRAFANVSPNQPAVRLLKCLAKVGSPSFVNATGNAALSDISGDGLRYQAAVEIPFEKEPGETDGAGRGAEQLLYVLFTSGSTGSPKGVLLSVGNILNTLEWSSAYADWRADDTIGLATNFYFDISLFDFFSMLYFDVPLVVLTNPSDALLTAREISDRRVTSLFAAPAFFSQFVRLSLLQGLGGLRTIFSGGDFFPPAHILEWARALPDVRLFNVWGPTETSIVNTMHLVDTADRARLDRNLSVPVGVSSLCMPFILIGDQDRIIDEPGRIGEIVMLGPSVGQGYLNESSDAGKNFCLWEGQRAYRTGDLGFFDHKQQLLIAGRKDHYVKLNGHRVELGEVESVASKTTDVFHALACVIDIMDGVQELWLAVEPKGETMDIGSVKAQCRKELPSYMVPKRVFVFPNLPRNHNGKIDRLATRELMLSVASR